MKIACIQAAGNRIQPFSFDVKYFRIKEEDDETITLISQEGFGPRGDYLYKEPNEYELSSGYSSLYLPCWVQANDFEVGGVVFVYENEIEKGKELLKKALFQAIEQKINQIESFKTAIQKA